MYFGGRGCQEKWNRGRGVERNYSSLKGITFAPSMSSTPRCSQILSRGYLLTLAVCLSVTLSVAVFSFQRDEITPPFFLLWLCAFVLVSLAHCYCLIISLLFRFRELQSATLKVKQEINTSLVLPEPSAWNNYMQQQHCCPFSDAADKPGSGPLR